MKKVYSQKASTEVFALAPEQLAIFKSAGYETQTAEEAMRAVRRVPRLQSTGRKLRIAPAHGADKRKRLTGDGLPYLHYGAGPDNRPHHNADKD